jgi:chemotaxis protein histidine kinase CheA
MRNTEKINDTMDYKDDMEIVSTFVSETRDHLDEIEYGILKFENTKQGLDSELIDSMFRAAHSIKAGANLLEFKNIEEVSHALENILQKLRLENLALDSEMVTVLLEAIDTIRELVDYPQNSDFAHISTLVGKLQTTTDR